MAEFQLSKWMRPSKTNSYGIRAGGAPQGWREAPVHWGGNGRVEVCGTECDRSPPWLVATETTRRRPSASASSSSQNPSRSAAGRFFHAARSVTSIVLRNSTEPAWRLSLGGRRPEDTQLVGEIHYRFSVLGEAGRDWRGKRVCEPSITTRIGAWRT